MEVHVLPETSRDINMSTVKKYYSNFFFFFCHFVKQKLQWIIMKHNKIRDTFSVYFLYQISLVAFRHLKMRP
jgi:hypothetical protein